jgi:single-strand DNA-binding protein
MFNRVVLVGNLTRDPEVRFTPNGTAVCNFGIATNRKYGEKEEVFFGEITAWGKLGETCEKYLKKGSKALIDGRLLTETWETEDGKKKSKTRIVAENVRFMDSKPKSEQEPHEQAPVEDGEIPF